MNSVGVETRTRRERAGTAVIVLVSIVITAATLLPVSQDVVSSRWCIICGEMGTLDVLLNVVLFAPLGAGFALRGTGFRAALLIMLLATVGIEAAQLGVVPGRDASIGDVFANSVGGALGFVAGRRGGSWLWASPLAARQLLAAWMTGWCAVQVVVSYALRPAPSRHRYYGQITPALGNLPAYPGHVVRATIGGDAIPGVEFADSPRIRAHLRAREGAMLEVDFVPAPVATHETFSIVRIADDAQHEILALSVRDRDLIFSIRSGASALRLRPLQFALTDVLSAARDAGSVPPRDTVRVRVRAAPSGVEFGATGGALRQHRRYVPTLSDGWRLFTPRQTIVAGAPWELAMGVVWIALLLFPAGYLLARVARSDSAGAASRGQAVVLRTVMVVIIGAVAAPTAMGVPVGATAFAALAVALLGGWGLGSRRWRG